MINLSNHWKTRALMTEQKYIALIDCDSFFVSCERKLNPTLKGKVVCVTSGERGCVIARSKEAKNMGIPMGQPLFMAKKEFPKCIYITANHADYQSISHEIMALLREISPTVEVYSIDEAFVDLTGLSKLYKMNYFKLAQHIRNQILEKIDIPVSIGISRTKPLAKLASDKSKDTESHICIAGHMGIKKLLNETEIGEVWGIGRRLEPKLKAHGIKTAYDYVQKNDVWLKSRFGKLGLELKYELSGNLINKVTNEQKLPKSISDSRAFEEFSSDLNYIRNELMVHIHSACRKLRRVKCKCFTVGVMLRTKDFKVYYVKDKLNSSSNFEFEISEKAFELLNKIYNDKVIYRSVGIVLEDFNPVSKEQLNLFESPDSRREKNEKLAESIDRLESKFGRNIVKTGFTYKDIPIKQDFLTNPEKFLS